MFQNRFLYFVKELCPGLAPVPFSALISSFGGTGSTALMEYAQQYIAINSPHNQDGYKHLLSPPKHGTNLDKAVLVIGDPRNATISLFKRGFARTHCQRLNPLIGYLTPARVFYSLDNYLLNGKDLFGFEACLSNWLKQANKRNYPIMIIKYESLWHNLPELLEFINIPVSALNDFPKELPRKADWKELDGAQQTLMQKLYGPLSEFIQSLDDCFIA